MLSVSSVVNSAVFRVDKTATDQVQRCPIDVAGEPAREVCLEKSAGIVGVRESGFDELVVGLMERTLGHGGGELKTARRKSTGGK